MPLGPQELAKLLEAHTAAIVDTLHAAGRPHAQVVVVWFDEGNRELISANMERDAMIGALALAITHVVSSPVVMLPPAPLPSGGGTVN